MVRKSLLFAAVLLFSVAPLCGSVSQASAAVCTSAPTHVGHLLGIERPARVPVAASCAMSARIAASTAYNGGSPPLTFKNGEVMGSTDAPGAVTLTPVYWAPNQSSFDSGYESLSTKFIDDLAAGTTAHSTASPFSVLTQYTNASGTRLLSQMSTTQAVQDTQAYPVDPRATGCSPDQGKIYNDNSGYRSCLDDDDIMAELQRLTSDEHLPTDWAHLYVVYLPKGVEDCMSSKAEENGGSSHNCTANYVSAQSSYCAYHSYVTPAPTDSPLLYAVIPYSIWNSATGIGCNGFPDAPNSDPAVDYSASEVSHEIAEAITDPEGSLPSGHGWMDKSGNEIGDLCAYTYGPLHGALGQRSDVTLNGSRYLIQQEFSNAAYRLNHAQGCQASWSTPSVSLRQTGQLVVGKKVTVTPTISTPSGTMTSAAWTLDGSPVSAGATYVTKTLTPGTHTVGLTVTDSGGYQGSGSLTFSVKEPKAARPSA